MHIYHCKDFIKLCDTIVMKLSVVGHLRDKGMISLYGSELMESIIAQQCVRKEKEDLGTARCVKEK